MPCSELLSATTVPELFGRLASWLVTLDSQWTRPRTPSLAQASSQQLTAHCREVDGLLDPHDRQRAPALGLRTLAQGVGCGALDGLLLYRAGRWPEHPVPDSSRLAPQFRLLRQSLERACQAADGEWRQHGADTLHLLSGYAKSQNLQTQQEAESASWLPFLDFQVFLLASFKAGYAIGLVDAGLVCLAGEQPEALVQGE